MGKDNVVVCEGGGVNVKVVFVPSVEDNDEAGAVVAAVAAAAADANDAVVAADADVVALAVACLADELSGTGGQSKKDDHQYMREICQCE